MDTMVNDQVMHTATIGSRVLIMGLTYKENVADTRETPAKELIKEFREYGVEIYGCDPLLDDIEQEFGIKPYDISLLTSSSQPSRHCEQSEAILTSSNRLLANDCRLSDSDSQLPAVDCIILTVAHDASKEITLDELKTVMNESPILIDV